jgi:hypothetical protein
LLFAKQFIEDTVAKLTSSINNKITDIYDIAKYFIENSNKEKIEKILGNIDEIISQMIDYFFMKLKIEMKYLKSTYTVQHQQFL